jgi:hypothetical protein
MTGENVTITKGVPDEDEIMLYDPLYAGFSYGPGNAGQTIDFGSRGGFAPNTWIGPRNHPLLNDMLLARPDLIEGTGLQPGPFKVLVCPECSREFNSLPGYKSHARTHRPGVTVDMV